MEEQDLGTETGPAFAVEWEVFSCPCPRYEQDKAGSPASFRLEPQNV